MGTVKQAYGPWSQAMLTQLRASGDLKVEAFVAWLAEREVRIDRTLVSHWTSGRSHLPADLLPLLAEFTGRHDIVFGEYLHAVRCEVYALPVGIPDGDELSDLVLHAGAAFGQLQNCLFEARQPDSPGGIEVVAEEREQIRDALDDLIQELAELRAWLCAEGQGRAPR